MAYAAAAKWYDHGEGRSAAPEVWACATDSVRKALARTAAALMTKSSRGSGRLVPRGSDHVGDQPAEAVGVDRLGDELLEAGLEQAPLVAGPGPRGQGDGRRDPAALGRELA